MSINRQITVIFFVHMKRDRFINRNNYTKGSTEVTLRYYQKLVNYSCRLCSFENLRGTASGNSHKQKQCLGGSHKVTIYMYKNLIGMYVCEGYLDLPEQYPYIGYLLCVDFEDRKF